MSRWQQRKFRGVCSGHTCGGRRCAGGMRWLLEREERRALQKERLFVCLWGWIGARARGCPQVFLTASHTTALVAGNEAHDRRREATADKHALRPGRSAPAADALELPGLVGGQIDSTLGCNGIS